MALPLKPASLGLQQSPYMLTLHATKVFNVSYAHLQEHFKDLFIVLECVTSSQDNYKPGQKYVGHSHELPCLNHHAVVVVVVVVVLGGRGGGGWVGGWEGE